MAELRVGGIAIVISSGNEQEVGKVVSLIRNLSSGEFHQFPNGSSYAMRTETGQQTWVVAGDVSIYKKKSSGGMSIFPARSLMPIDGDDFTNELLNEKELSNA